MDSIDLASEPNADELSSILENLADQITAQYTKYETGRLASDEANDCISDYIHEAREAIKARDRTRALAILEEVEREVIGPHLPGCPAITKYVGPEGTPYDGPRCDCGVLEQRTAIARLKDKYGV